MLNVNTPFKGHDCVPMRIRVATHWHASQGCNTDIMQAVVGAGGGGGGLGLLQHAVCTCLCAVGSVYQGDKPIVVKLLTLFQSIVT